VKPAQYNRKGSKGTFTTVRSSLQLLRCFISLVPADVSRTLRRSELDRVRVRTAVLALVQGQMATTQPLSCCLYCNHMSCRYSLAHCLRFDQGETS
jgi:hypothetical protein